MNIGRPKGENNRTKIISLRLTEEEFKDIENLSEMLKISRTETIIRAIKLFKQNPKPKRFKNISGKNEKNSDGVETDGIIRKIVTPIKV